MKSRSPWQASAITACVAASAHGASASVSAVTILRGRFRLSSLRLRHNYFAWPLPPLSSPNLKLTIPYTHSLYSHQALLRFSFHKLPRSCRPAHSKCATKQTASCVIGFFQRITNFRHRLPGYNRLQISSWASQLRLSYSFSNS